MPIVVCPSCKNQLEVKLTFASGPKNSSSQRESVDSSDVGDLLDSVDMGNLNDFEREFIEQTKERFAKYKDNIRMSDKQMAVLRKIAAKDF